ncbi:MAG: MlaD family protein [Ignavibacteria bacterium]|jgi:phospholipid/cholesterol/gamma-HCH transport system substrate-binding protein|nr:MlaD family protein [Ignavibacteria bacterium]
MNKNTANEIKVGIVALTALLLLVGIIAYMKGISMSDKDVSVLFVFDNSLGLTAGSPVVVNGVKRGEVTDIWNADGQVYVRTTLGSVSDIKADATAAITILELTGGKKVELIPGNSDVAYNPSNTIRGLHSSDLQTLVHTIGDLESNLISIVQRLDTVLTVATSALADTNLFKDIRSIVSNTTEATSDLKDILHSNKDGINATLRDMEVIMKDLRVAISDNKPEVEHILHNVDSLTERLKYVLARTDTTFTSANSILKNIDSVVKDVQGNNGGTISKLLYDKEFSKKLDSLMMTIDELAKQINDKGIKARLRL